MLSAICFNSDQSKILSSGYGLTSTPQMILSKPLAAFRHNYHRNNGQLWEKNKSCHICNHQYLERILAQPGINLATSCTHTRIQTGYISITYFLCTKTVVNFFVQLLSTCPLLPSGEKLKLFMLTLYYTILTFNDPEKEAF